MHRREEPSSLCRWCHLAQPPALGQLSFRSHPGRGVASIRLLLIPLNDTLMAPKKVRERTQHPDDFLLSLFDVTPGLVCGAVKRQREGLRNPPKTAEELLATLENQGLTQAVARLREFVELL